MRTTEYLILFVAAMSASWLTAEPVHLFLAGDSTMAEKAAVPDNPERGWGEALGAFFDSSVRVENRALNGRSSKSFRDEGHWEKLLNDLMPSDWVWIQFGHNDQKAYDPSRYAEARTDYRDNLVRFIKEVREAGGDPLLATPIVRRRFDEQGQLVPTHGDYPAVVREVAREYSVPLIDLQAATSVLISELGPDKSKEYYLFPRAGLYARFPDGHEDNTHLSLLGATVIAQLAAEELQKLGLPLAEHLIEPMHDYRSVDWEPIYPEELMPVPAGEDDEYIEDNRVHQVRRPHMAYFRSAIGQEPRPVVVICPGGGYHYLTLKKEGSDIARWFNSVGVDACVLKYRMKEFGYPAPLQDVTRTVRLLRSTAAERGLDPERIGVMGFSAGGHAAGMGTTLWDSPDAKVGDALDAVSARPDFSILAYPVLTMEDRFTHAGSRENLLGKNPSPELLQKVSIEKNVTPATPPVFLMHTAEDDAVPAENSLWMAEALHRNGVPVALHLYARGHHGIGMLPGYGPASDWPMALAQWLVEQGIVREEANE